jgi:hypothetical protein
LVLAGAGLSESDSISCQVSTRNFSFASDQPESLSFYASASAMLAFEYFASGSRSYGRVAPLFLPCSFCGSQDHCVHRPSSSMRLAGRRWYLRPLPTGAGSRTLVQSIHLCPESAGDGPSVGSRFLRIGGVVLRDGGFPVVSGEFPTLFPRRSMLTHRYCFASVRVGLFFSTIPIEIP